MTEIAAKTYSYKLRRYRRDGTEVFYDCNISYTPKKIPKVFSAEDIELIRQRLADGVTKKRICEDYGISFIALRKLL